LWTAPKVLSEVVSSPLIHILINNAPAAFFIVLLNQKNYQQPAVDTPESGTIAGYEQPLRGRTYRTQ
jgi:hypothetical protein